MLQYWLSCSRIIQYWIIAISNERRDFPVNLILECLFGSLFKWHIETSHHWSFVSGIQRWPVDSRYKGTVMWTAILCHDVITYWYNRPTLLYVCTSATYKGLVRDEGLCVRSTALLTHLPMDKMAAILADDICKCIYLNGMIEFRFKFHWNCSQESIWQ